MALQRTEVKRKFVYKAQRLEDYPNLSPAEIIKVHSKTHPELVNASFKYNGIENGEQVYIVESKGGTNG